MAIIHPAWPLLAAVVLGLSTLIGYTVIYMPHPYQNADRSSAANINEVRCEFVTLDLHVNFAQKTLEGSATETFRALRSGVSTIALDTKDVSVSAVRDETHSNRSLEFRVMQWPWFWDEPMDVLVIFIGRELAFDERVTLRIWYKTSPQSYGLNWLNENQTGTKRPFFYADCEPHYCRCMAPLQDTPSVKTPFVFRVRADKEWTVLTSGIPKSNWEENGLAVHEFEQKVPVPSYLIAIVVGILERRTIDHRTQVYAEPGLINRTAEVLSDIGTFLDIIENDLTPYRWQYYGIVVMPFAYPMGGMENPQLTFMNPAIIKAGKEAEDVAAHEIVHSWFGNLLTCSNWTHTWLNEGLTMFGERRIVERFFGHEFYQASAAVGMHDLQETLGRMDDEEQQRILCHTNRRNPEYGFSLVQYEKGFTLAKKLENLTGSVNFFEFLRTYLMKYEYQSVETDDFRNTFEQFVTGRLKNGSEILRQIDWTRELRGTGMPSPLPVYTSPKIDQARELAREYVRLQGRSPDHPEQYKGFFSLIKEIFMIELTKLKAPGPVVERVDLDLDVTNKETNPEILLYWLVLNIKSRLGSVKSKVEEFLGGYGRGRYLTPTYAALAAVDRDYARTVFAKYRDGYHPRVADNLAEMLGQ